MAFPLEYEQAVMVTYEMICTQAGSHEKTSTGFFHGLLTQVISIYVTPSLQHLHKLHVLTVGSKNLHNSR